MLGEQLKAYREARGQSREDFAAFLNEGLERSYDRQRISRWENGGERIPQAVVAFVRKHPVLPVEKPGPALVVSLANQKGGVGKTTGCVNVGRMLADRGYSVVLVDSDPQANAGIHLSVDVVACEDAERTLYYVLKGAAKAEECLVETRNPRLRVLPSSLKLAESETELAAQQFSHNTLRSRLADLRRSVDFILIDCPPTLGHLVTNALVASDTVLIPCQTQPLAFMGMGTLRKQIDFVRERGNPTLSLLGIVPTFYSGRTTQDQATLKDMHDTYGQEVHIFPPIPNTTLYPQSSAGGDALVAFNAKAPGIGTFDLVVQTLIAERDRRIVPAGHGVMTHG